MRSILYKTLKRTPTLFQLYKKPTIPTHLYSTKQEKTLLLNVQGMRCGGCVKKVEDTLYKHSPNIRKVNANYITGIVSVTLNSEHVPTDLMQNLREILGKLGYIVSLYNPQQASTSAVKTSALQQMSLTSAKRKLSVSLGFGIPLVVLSMAEMMLHVHMLPPQFSNWVQLILATPVVLYGAAGFFKRAFTLLKSFSANMDTLIATGVGVSYLWSVGITFLGLSGVYPVYFETAGMITCLVLIGRFLEARARSKTTEAIDELYKLQPKHAKVLSSIENMRDVKRVPVSELKEGDSVLVVPGEYICADGVVVQGETFVDETLLTGESYPRKKTPGSTVIAGTMNFSQKDAVTGSIIFRVTRTGENTTLANIIKSVQMAQSTKLSNMQTLADKVSAVFSGFIISFAALTFAAHLAFGSPLNVAIATAVAVLVISCPCSVGLAFPTAITVATGRAASSGLLIRNVQVLEKLSSGVDVVVFDKTGTLTEGKPQVQEFVKISTRELDNKIFTIIGALEQRSEHPLAKAITAYCEEHGDKSVSTTVTNFSSSSSGIRGEVNGVEVMCGKMEFVFENTNPSDEVKQYVHEQIERISSEAKTPAVVAIDGEIIGIFCIFDKLKPNAIQVLSELHDMGIMTILLTGDRSKVADAIAKQINAEKQVLSSVIASVTPDQKLAYIQNLQSKNFKVMMVGDGINDSPALSQADIGVALSTGTDIAAKSADIVIMGGDVEKLMDSIRISKATMRIIKQNLWWAFGYNIFAIPLAAVNLLHPMFAGALMSVSSLCVVQNSLRLRKKI